MSSQSIPNLGSPHRWLVTGVAGFIGSHLLETLLAHDQEVVGLDNFRTGRRANLEDVRSRVTAERWARFRFVEGDIFRPTDVAEAVAGTEFVLHQAALGSVPQSIEDPLTTHAINVTGFLHVLEASRRASVRRVVYASSSAVYGDATDLPATEDRIGRPLSPYAASKSMNEQYAAVFERCYDLVAIGLRYFNVFGPRQDPNSQYSAVIPLFITAMLAGRQPVVYGDGGQSRDFTFIDNVVHGNLLAADADARLVSGRVFNVANGRSTSLLQLLDQLNELLGTKIEPVHKDPRVGDVRESLADITQARTCLAYEPQVSFEEGLKRSIEYYRTIAKR